MPAVGITTGQPQEVLLEAGACMLVDDFHQLLQVALEHAATSEGQGAEARSGMQQAVVEVRS